jgi:CheY-like chemotaxis protein
MQKRILVVDDEQGILKLVRAILEDEGYSVQTSVDGQCFQNLQGDLPDLILLDIMLGGEDGRDLCVQVKQKEETRHIPVILCSAYFRGDIITYLAGASTFLPKPFEIDDLINTVARYTSSTQEREPSFPETSRER